MFPFSARKKGREMLLFYEKKKIFCCFFICQAFVQLISETIVYSGKRLLKMSLWLDRLFISFLLYAHPSLLYNQWSLSCDKKMKTSILNESQERPLNAVAVYLCKIKFTPDEAKPTTIAYSSDRIAICFRDVSTFSPSIVNPLSQGGNCRVS